MKAITVKSLKAVLAAGTATAAVVGSVALAGPASATTYQGNCGSTARMCLYYHSSAYGWGAEYGHDTNVPSFNPANNGGNTYVFKAGIHGSAGAGQTVWNNAAAGSNWSGSQNFAVWQNHGYGGSYDVVPYGLYQDLNHTHNNDTSMAWI
jgi:hypothetical protein